MTPHLFDTSSAVDYHRYRHREEHQSSVYGSRTADLLPVPRQGTAKTEILDICGLDGSTRVITAALIPKSKISEIFELLEKTFEIRKKGKGIALTLPITGVQASMLNLLSAEQEKIAKAHIERKVQQMINETSYAMITVAVREGFSDEVIDAATKAGASGGSVIRGRRRGTEALYSF